MGMNERTAQEMISPDIAGPLLDSIVSAYADWHTLVSADVRAVASLTTKASFINDRMVFHARDGLKSHPKVEFVLRYGRTHLVIDGQIEMKLKKLNARLRPSNILTAAVRDYHNQVPIIERQLEFPNMRRDLVNLIAGYHENRLRTGIEAVYVVHPKGSDNTWEWKIDFAATPMPMVSVPSSASAASRKARPVVPKTKAVQAKASKGSSE